MRRRLALSLGRRLSADGRRKLAHTTTMCLKILYALFVVGVRCGGAFLRFCRALVPSRISLMTTTPSAEAFFGSRCRASGRFCGALWRTLGTLAAHKRNEVLNHWVISIYSEAPECCCNCIEQLHR